MKVGTESTNGHNINQPGKQNCKYSVGKCTKFGFKGLHNRELRTAMSQWLRYCATNRKVTGSIPGGVIGIFH
jgi:hypothetical protein